MSFNRTLLESFVIGPKGFASASDEKPLPEYLPPELLHRYFCIALFWGIEDHEDYIPRLCFCPGPTFPSVKLADESGNGGSYGLTFVPATPPSSDQGVFALLRPKFFTLKNGMMLLLDDMPQVVSPDFTPEQTLKFLDHVASQIENFAKGRGLYEGKERRIGSLEDRAHTE